MLEMKGNEILNNIKIHWISMLSPSKKILSECKLLVVKMVGDNATIDNVKTN
jgi:hypothetical protein